MKTAKLFLNLIILMLLPANSWGVASAIRHVEIYPWGAAVTREVILDQINGESQELELDGLPSTLMDSSIQIAPVDSAGVQIGGFSFLPDGNPVEEDDERTAGLRDTIEQINDKVRVLKQERKSIVDRVQHYNLLAQSIRKSLEEKASPEAYELARNAWAELETVNSAGDKRIAELDKENHELALERNRVQEDLDELVNKLSRKSGVLRFDLKTDLSEVKLLVRYQVREAGWRPVHEIRAIPADGTVSWIYKAQIHQDSGEDWTNVSVSLNSASALDAAGLPDLDPLFLSRMERPVSYDRKITSQSLEVSMAAPAMMEAVPESTTTGFFIRLPQPLTLVSGKEPVVREAFSGVLKADFWSEAVPELSTEAWLMAGMVNDLGWPILAGESYSYIDGQLVARRYIEGIAAGEDIELSLGRNEKISIERKERVKKESEGGLIDRTKRHDVKYETTVGNRMQVAHRVVLKDRFPIGRDNKIQVRTISPKDVEPEEGTGIFKWERTLRPGSSDVLVTEYIVTYPSEWTVYPPLK